MFKIKAVESNRNVKMKCSSQFMTILFETRLLIFVIIMSTIELAVWKRRLENCIPYTARMTDQYELVTEYGLAVSISRLIHCQAVRRWKTLFSGFLNVSFLIYCIRYVHIASYFVKWLRTTSFNEQIETWNYVQ